MQGNQLQDITAVIDDLDIMVNAEIFIGAYNSDVVIVLTCKFVVQLNRVLSNCLKYLTLQNNSQNLY